MPVDALGLHWIRDVNARVHRLADYPTRMNAWNEYVEAIVAARRAAVRFLTRVTQILKLYFKRKKPAALFQALLRGALGREDDPWARQPMLPKAAVDEWGDVAEPSQASQGHCPRSAATSLALQRLQPVLRAQREHGQAVGNFIRQSKMALDAVPFFVRGTEQQASAVRELLRSHRLTEEPGRLPLPISVARWSTCCHSNANSGRPSAAFST